MVATTVYGYPRIGAHRELKAAVEGYWKGTLDAAELAERAARIRAENWSTMAAAGLTELPSNDFSLYDHVLDTACVLGATPRRFRTGTPVGLDDYFAMARGGGGQPPLAMTKWLDTNYHYLVPELGPDLRPAAGWRKPLDEFTEALALGHRTRPVLLGPVSFLLLGKAGAGTDPTFDPLTLLEPLLAVYRDLLAELAAAGAEWVQLDEPALVRDRTPAELRAVAVAYGTLTAAEARPKICVATYFGSPREALPALVGSGIEGLGLDAVRGAETNLADLEKLGGFAGRRLVVGVVDGRNVWRADLGASLDVLARFRDLAGEVVVGASCSLLHVPVDVALETGSAEWLPQLAFARQKLDEICVLARGLEHGRDAIAAEIDANGRLLADRRSVPGAVRTDVRDRAARAPAVPPLRPGSYGVRQRALRLPVLPTTTVGSFPQTGEMRAARAQLAAGRLSDVDYERQVEDEIARVVEIQHDAELDVLVHGEPERGDMVEYFAQRLDGFGVTTDGWVQSYGSRCVRPPIVVGDVARPGQLTVRWISLAQAMTSRPVKGMLTGPVTMLKWSFGRADETDDVVRRQIALALRDEVADLDAAGVRIIQIDEPALREGLPLRAADQPAYLSSATAAFRMASGAAGEMTQIHSHMCYAEFGEVLHVLRDLDADVLLVEAARSGMGMVGDLAGSNPLGAIGPGVYDIHSPRVPTAEEMADLLRAACAAMPAERIWVTPDCGLKTRRYDEVVPALLNLRAASRTVRAEVGASELEAV